MTTNLRQLSGDRLFVTDGGLETKLIFYDGLELPHFAAFPLFELGGCCGTDARHVAAICAAWLAAAN